VKKILIVVNNVDFFISHRLPIAKKALEEGFQVHVSASGDGGELKKLCPGIKYHSIDISRSGQNPLLEIRTVYQLYKVYKGVGPDLVHLVTIKPVLYGGVLARLTGIKGVLVAISGLGSVFSAVGVLPLIRLKIIHGFYKLALKHRNLDVIFQNECDKESLLSFIKVEKNRVHLIPGSGVSLDEYQYIPELEQRPVVSMAARLLKEKGVREFVAAADLLKQREVGVRMIIIGEPDEGNPSSVTLEDISSWKKRGSVEFLGFRNDINTIYSNSNIVCLPSYYGEGLPKGLVEAAACGRAIITTDMPGCRDSILPDETGLLVAAKDELALADAIEVLVNDTEKRKKMGAAGRKLAEEKFSIESVVNQHFDIYNELLINAG
jgi:glycosyltransferase involved in cell wall biosynthesis